MLSANQFTVILIMENVKLPTMVITCEITTVIWRVPIVRLVMGRVILTE